MKILLSAAVVITLALASGAYADLPPNVDKVAPAEKQTAPHGEGDGNYYRQGGETMDDCTVIESVPFEAYGTTTGYEEDYDEMCPYGANAPDVVYCFSPSYNLMIDVDLCDSYYDTKVYIFEDYVQNTIACSDDHCSGPNYPYPYLSYITGAVLYEGHTYYIIVDGYGNSNGEYVMKIEQTSGCDLDCPPEAVIEQEPWCEDNWVDRWNGGCNSVPTIFEVIEPCCLGEIITLCGTSGTYRYDTLHYRDTDWFELNVTEPTTITWCCVGAFPMQMMLIDEIDGCNEYDIVDERTADFCEEACITYALDPGTWWLWVGPSVFYGVPCGTAYIMTIDGFNTGIPSGAYAESWGTVKSLYR